MRTHEEHPATEIEQTIFDILVKSGLKPEEIQFRGGPNHSHKGTRYLRYGYWSKLAPSIFEQIKHWVVEYDYDDDDCGTLYNYPFK